MICDDGAGIDADVLPRIFDPFFTTKDVGKGTGLGLAMVHSLVHKAGGHVLIRSGRDEGTSVGLLLPVADVPPPPAVEPALPPAAPALPAPSAAGATGQRIWVVDDDPTVLVFLGDLLQGQGHQVTCFRDPLLARQALQREPMALDCLLTDQTMPHLSGADLARAALALRPTLPVILCTGYSDRIDEAGAAALGVQHFLRKPFEIQALLAALAAHAPALA
jgi:CheY-like chemotaxis protein